MIDAKLQVSAQKVETNYAPSVASLIKATTTIIPGCDVAAVLDSDTSGLGIRSKDIESVIWSHNHFDHIGDITTFPSTTELVVGPGVATASWPGWPLVQEAKLLESNRHRRQVREIDFDQDLCFGNFKAFDFFSDGSFYLLDAPGHATASETIRKIQELDADDHVFVIIAHDVSLRSENALLPGYYKWMDGERFEESHALAFLQRL
ncbi:hypothetical protein O1611_g6310 [Lasiodiplodia mahajangana]|uniref:Uncharacterized protein n=1 Tax=Lasiodiplodia mahajangana TaxID=1108764 RepID=A0ACC2JIK2_9PEZI|nr:hypothetical protein O1611_g6310 [Lasiodiplodia mahajangana]